MVAREKKKKNYYEMTYLCKEYQKLIEVSWLLSGTIENNFFYFC